MDIKTLAKVVVDIVSKHSQTITGVGAVFGLGVTTYLTFNTAEEIKEVLKEHKEEVREIQKSDASDEEVKTQKKELDKQTRRKVIKKAAPVVAAFTATAALMIGTVVISNLKIQNLSSMATFSELAYQELLNKTKEEVGEEKAAEMKKEVEETVQKEVNEASVSDVARQGERQLYVDYLTKNTFWLTPKELADIIYYFNKTVKDDNSTIDIPLVTFYNKIAAKGNPHMYDIPLAEGFAWRSSTYRRNCIQLNDHNAMRTPQGAAIVMDFYERPKFWEDLL